MRSEAGSKIKPGSEAERDLLNGFKKSRASQVARETEARGTAGAPGPIAKELLALERGDGIIHATDAAQARRDGSAAISELVSTDMISPASIQPTGAASGVEVNPRAPQVPIRHG